MPLYEYECEDCGNIEERLQKFSDKPLTRCNHCSGRLHKLISQSSFHLKGTGWYVTDYATKGKDPASGSTAKGAAASKTTAPAEKTAKSADVKSAAPPPADK